MFGYKSNRVKQLEKDLALQKKAYADQSAAFADYRSKFGPFPHTGGGVRIAQLESELRKQQDWRAKQTSVERLRLKREEFAQQLMLQHGWDASRAADEAATLFPETRFPEVK